MTAKKAARKNTTKRASKQDAGTAKPSSRKTATKKVATRKTAKSKVATKKSSARTSASKNTSKPVLLSGGNPQIAKGYGDAPVQAYINALSDWRRDVTRNVDAIVTRALPKVQKAVKWNSPLYGAEENHYFLGIHVFAKYVKLAFFIGRSLDPMPPGESKTRNARYLDIREDDTIDEKQLVKWVKQASKIKGEKM